MKTFFSYAIRSLIFVGLIAGFIHFLPPLQNFASTYAAFRGFRRLVILFALGAFVALFIKGPSLSNRSDISTRPLFVIMGILMMAGACYAVWWLRDAFPQ